MKSVRVLKMENMLICCWQWSIRDGAIAGKSEDGTFKIFEHGGIQYVDGAVTLLKRVDSFNKWQGRVQDYRYRKVWDLLVPRKESAHFLRVGVFINACLRLIS